MRLRLAVLVLLALLSTHGTSWGQQSGAVPVGTVAAALRPITQSTDFVGRVEAKERVDIRARVTGFLQAVLFNEGDYVKEGQVPL